MQPVVPAENFAGCGYDISCVFRKFLSLLLQISFDKANIIPRGYKTNFLALGLSGYGNLQPMRDIPDFVLGKLPERKIGVRKLVLGQTEKKIGLVLGFVRGAQKLVTTGVRIMTDARVMPRGDAFGANLASGDEQLVELHVIVAESARNRSTALQIVVHEGTDDVLLEFALQIEYVKRDAEMFGDATRIVDIINRATTMLRRLGGLELREAALVPELHGEADDGLAALVHDRSDGGTVHTSTHGDCHGRDGAGRNHERKNFVGSCGHRVARGLGYGAKRFELCQWICHCRFTVHASRLRCEATERAIVRPSAG